MKNLCKSNPCKQSCVAEPCDVLGLYPATAVAALADLGLTDQEIAGYFHILPERITRLRLKVAPEVRLVRVGDAALTLELDRQ